VLDVLETLAQRPDRSRSLADLVRATGMTRATAHAVLDTLVQRGWVQRSEVDKTYSVGSYFAAVGQALAGARPVEHLAHEAISKLAAEHDATAVVVHVVDGALVVTDVAPAPSAGPGRGWAGVREPVRVGSRAPYVPPFGLGFAAWAPPEEQEAWLAHAAGNTRLVDRLRAVLPQVRRRGYTLDRLDPVFAGAFEVLARLQQDVLGEAVREVVGRVLDEVTLIDHLPEEVESGEVSVSSITAPVLDATGRVVLDLAVQPAGPRAAAELTALGEAVADAAARVSAAASTTLEAR
jgi:DNA-binding IclR family transcriptional regulator